ncbi:MAG TPA: hypothetical protein VFK09_00895 [Gemmatimonadales bacterium]|nr:hypothetical protein [Gemmatimonadales bacterium]
MSARVLIVDNEPRHCRALARAVRALQHEVITAGDINAAYLVLEERRVDAVILHLQLGSAMGEALGLALMRQWPHLVGRLVLTSSEPAPAAGSWPAELERCPLLQRPVAPAALARTLGEVLTASDVRKQDSA